MPSSFWTKRLEQAQHSDTGLQMGDVLGVIGFRHVAAYIGGMRSQIADSDGRGRKLVVMGYPSRRVRCGPRLTRVTNPRLQGSPDKKPTFPLRGSGPSSSGMSGGQFRALLPVARHMMVSTRMVVAGLSAVSPRSGSPIRLIEIDFPEHGLAPDLDRPEIVPSFGISLGVESGELTGRFHRLGHEAVTAPP